MPALQRPKVDLAALLIVNDAPLRIEFLLRHVAQNFEGIVDGFLRGPWLLRKALRLLRGARKAVQRLRASGFFNRTCPSEVDRLFVSVISQSRHRQLIARVHNHFTLQEFHRGCVSCFVAYQVMDLNVRSNAEAFSILDSFHRRRRIVQQILNPFLRANRRARIVFWIFCLVQPHLFDDQPSLVHPAGRIFAPVLIESDAAIPGYPFCGIRRVSNRCSFCYAAFVDEDQCVADAEVVVPAEQNFAIMLQAKCRASKRWTD